MVACVQLNQMEAKQQRELDRIRKKQKELANHQHSYTKQRKESSKQRADELQQSEADWEKDEQFILAMEKDVKEKCQANALNQENPEVVGISCGQWKRKLRQKELH